MHINSFNRTVQDLTFHLSFNIESILYCIYVTSSPCNIHPLQRAHLQYCQEEIFTKTQRQENFDSKSLLVERK